MTRLLVRWVRRLEAWLEPPTHRHLYVPSVEETVVADLVANMGTSIHVVNKQAVWTRQSGHC